MPQPARTAQPPQLHVLAATASCAADGTLLKVMTHHGKTFVLHFAPHLAAKVGIDIQSAAAQRRPYRRRAKVVPIEAGRAPILKPSGALI